MALLLALPVPGSAAGTYRPATVQRQDADRVVFRVTVPDVQLVPGTLKGTERVAIDGYSHVGDPSAPPTLTRSFLVGLPPDGSYSLSFRLITSTSLGTHKLEPMATPIGIRDDELGPTLSDRVQWNDEIYNAYRDPALVSADPLVYVRHQRALPVRVNPLAYDPKSQTLSVAKVIEIEVRFARSQRSSAESMVPAAAENKDWNDTYARLLVNSGQAKPWRVSLAPALDQTVGVQARVAAGAVKVHVYQTGMHTVRASRAIAAGFPAGQPVANLRVFRRVYNDNTLSASETEIACEVNEDPSGTPGIFDGNDDVVFYARRLRDEPSQGDGNEQFSAYNVYWLEPSNGTRMAQSTPGIGFVTADTTAATFPVQDHFEIDNYFRDGTPPGLPGAEDVYYYNSGFETDAVDMPFTVGNIQPGTTLSLSAELDGQTYDAPRALRVALFNAHGETALNPGYQMPAKIRRTFVANVAASDLNLGTNQFRINRPDASRSAVQVLVNFVDVSYNSLFRARANTLHFNSATLAGDTTITVTGITATGGLELFDITNPDQPERLVLSAGHFQPAGGGTALSFRRNYAARHQYMLIPDARMVDVKAADIVGDNPSSIIGSSAESGVDVLVVAHHDFVPGMRAWASYRRAQGYRVLLVDVDDVFDEFNGGVPNARAVYRFARHFFEHGNAGTLVLVGDASEDHKHVFDDSGTDFVPTYTRLENVSVLALDEVVTTDKRFVKFPGPGGGVDEIPDMIVGRIPVGDTGELQSVLDKVYLFEAPSASDFWRKRMILVADDEFSEGASTFGGPQFCNNNEAGFQQGQENIAQTIENSLPAGYDVVRFYLKTYTDAFYTTNCANPFAAISYVRRNVTEKLMNELNQGATLFIMQAHMNRYTVTHERLLSGDPASVLDGTTGRDYLRVENRFKPWIVMAGGCHFSEYAPNKELAQENLFHNQPNGDCFAEQYLFQSERGAAGTYGSSGFEYLDRNVDYFNTMASVWFYQAPYDTMTAQTQAEWKLGQLLFLTEAQMSMSSAFQADAVERYHILGDPLLRIDAGPPAFNVTVNGHTAHSGDIVNTGGERDTILVVATVTDENAIHKFSLTIDGHDQSDSLKVVPLSDPSLPHARQYRVSFHHLLLPRTYDIVLRAFQSPDTTAGQYHMAAEFQLKVESSISVSVNGRSIQSGASVPADGDYRVDMTFPVFIPSSAIAVSIDDVAVTNAQYSHPSPEDSLTWIVTFRQKLDGGKHHMLVDAQGIQFKYELVVSESTGLRNVINYPNPFTTAGTRILYTNDVEIENGTIDIYTVSGKKVRRLDIPPGARPPGQNSVFWDGRDGAGGTLANGVYLYVINVHQRSGNATVRGTTNKIE
ncbi:MAG TPA: C25 family cysteine peptidase [Candidatus Krumholzibacteria bacterium]|nr:C25 family cysteine peptidase [Candidatus Krumholzibacteria bacterium]